MNLMTLGQSWPSCPHRYLHIDHLKSSEGRGRTGSVDLSVIRANMKVEDSNRVVTLECLQGSLLPTASPFTCVHVTPPPALGCQTLSSCHISICNLMCWYHHSSIMQLGRY